MAVDKIERAKGTAEHWQLKEVSERLEILLSMVDTISLPGFAQRAGRDVGDFFYLFQFLVKSALESSSDRPLPTVREARKYDANPFENSIHLNADKLEEVLVYREKARETLRKPAKTYGQSCERTFVLPSAEEIEEMRQDTVEDVRQASREAKRAQEAQKIEAAQKKESKQAAGQEQEPKPPKQRPKQKPKKEREWTELEVTFADISSESRSETNDEDLSSS
ncbi:MAG: hypothetical protein FWC86_00765 [Coriobacteriia bacterium]|nr:hypothetical protein [Coriobacteriia bacterium]